jgi:hypothetical protein
MGDWHIFTGAGAGPGAGCVGSVVGTATFASPLVVPLGAATPLEVVPLPVVPPLASRTAGPSMHVHIAGQSESAVQVVAFGAQ